MYCMFYIINFNYYPFLPWLDCKFKNFFVCFINYYIPGHEINVLYIVDIQQFVEQMKH